MKVLIAIVVSCMFIFIVIFVMQLLYVFVAVGYIELAKEYPIMNSFVGVLRYLVGIPFFLATMFAGGYLAANIANIETRIKVLLLSFAVGIFTTSGIIYPTLENSSLTITGIVIFILALIATTAGGICWLKKSDNINHNLINIK